MKRLIIFLILLFSVSICHAGIDLDGTDDSISIANESNFDFLTDDITGTFSISLWEKDSLDRGEFVSKQYQDGVTSYGTAFRSGSDGTLHLHMSGALPVDSNYYGWNTDDVVIGDGAWHHLVVTFDNQTVIFYVDGAVKTNTKTTGGTGADSGGNALAVKIGRRDGAAESDKAYFNGTVDEIAIWDVALSASEILQLYKARMKHMPLQIQSSNLKGYWPMDDGPHGTSADGDTVRDISGNGNDGTGDWGGNASGLTWQAEQVLSYP